MLIIGKAGLMRIIKGVCLHPAVFLLLTLGFHVPVYLSQASETSYEVLKMNGRSRAEV